MTCPICRSGSNVIHGCVSDRNEFIGRFPKQPKIGERPHRDILPLANKPINYSPAPIYGRNEPFSSSAFIQTPKPEEKLEASFDGVFIKIPKTKAGVMLAKEVLKLLEKQID